MGPYPKMKFFPLCDLHHCPMRRVMLEDSSSEENQSFHQCERRDIAFSVMVTAIRTLLTGGLMDRARLLERVLFVKEHSTSPK
jgi:hypothetical protein